MTTEYYLLVKLQDDKSCKGCVCCVPAPILSLNSYVNSCNVLKEITLERPSNCPLIKQKQPRCGDCEYFEKDRYDIGRSRCNEHILCGNRRLVLR